MSAPTDTAEPALVVEDTGDVLKVRFPVLVVEGMDAGDGRLITPGGFGCRPLPLSIAAQPYDPHGGQPAPAAEVFGHITTAERHPGPEVISPSTGEPFPEGVFVWSAEGEIDANHRWANLVRKGYLRGVSVVMGDMDAELIGEEEAALSDNPRRWAVVNSANIACVTLVPVPAFADTHLELVNDDTAMVAAADLPSELRTEPVPPWLSADLGDEVAAFAPTAESRRDAKKQGDTLPGTDKYPIRNREELRKAIKLVGSSDEPDAKVKAHIRRKARELDAEDMIPDSWAADGTLTAAAQVDDDQRAAITAAAAAMVDKLGPAGAYAAAPLVFTTPRHLTIVESVIELPSADDVVTASATADLPPRAWFDPPEDLPPGTGHYVDGRRVYGRLAEWDVPHIGANGQSIYAPRSPSGYRWFHTKQARVQGSDGPERIKIGHITFGIGHAPTEGIDHLAAAAHYDNSRHRGAKIRMYEDRYGPVYAGALSAGMDGARLEEFEESDTSGDWRRIRGHLELVAALCVNVGGFPKVGLALAASGEPLALVASASAWGRGRHGDLDYDTLAAAIASRLRASDADERERAALAAELADDDSDEERLAALAGLDEGEEFTALATFVSEHADADDASFASLMPPQLQRSYLAGEVATRIVWGTPGDFRRCVVQAKAHGMGRKAQGACNYLHNKAVGFYPGDRRNK